MDDGVHLESRQQIAHQRGVAEIPFDKGRLRRHGPAEAGGEIVQHHDPFAAVDQPVELLVDQLLAALGGVKLERLEQMAEVAERLRLRGG
jgi:hypothetical protein